jgi:trk system potassium uptake protein TrkA
MRRRPQKSFLVIGMGRFGASLAIELTRLGHEVMGVDTDMDVVERFKNVIHEVHQADGCNPRAIEELGVESYHACIVGRGEDLGESITITVNLRDLGAKRIIAKAVTEQHARILTSIGADQVVFPERESGERLAHTLASPRIADFFELAPNVSMIEVDPPAMSHHKSLMDLQLRRRFGITVIGVRRHDEFIANPGPDSVVEPGDRLIVIGGEIEIEEFLAS